MKVFKISRDYRYQYFLPEDDHNHVLSSLDATPRLANWNPPAVFVYEPKLMVGNFYNTGVNLIADQRATDALRPLFEMAGELLPLDYKGQRFTVLNVMVCVDCLDHDKSEWRIGPSGSRSLVKPVFSPELLPPSPIFKIHDTIATFLTEGLLAPDQEFREIVRREGLKGLKFEEIELSGPVDGPA